MHFAFANTGDRINRKQEVPISEPEESAPADFQHPNFALVLVDEQTAYVTDILTLSVDYFAIANIQVRVGKDKTRIAEFFEFSIRRR
jgi:hypothetical protein